jgi:hypothetical protein
MNETRFAPERIVAALNAGNVSYVVVGGFAVAAHGVVRATRDLDVVPDPDVENLDRLANALMDLGAEHPVEDVLTGASLSSPVWSKLRTRHGEIQLLNRMPAVPPFSKLIATAISVEIGEEPALVCSLADLRAMKLASGRPRDLVDVAELDELHGLQEAGSSARIGRP